MSREDFHVLLIEDNPGDVRLIEEMLDEKLSGSATSTTGDAPETQSIRHADRLEDGLQQLEEHSIDVILLDLGLPDSTGLDTLDAVRSRSQDVSIVVLTGLSDEAVGDQAVQHGAQEYLVKDELTPALLRRSLRHAIERKKFERTQTALHNASRELVHAESQTEVCELTVETAVDVLDLPGVGIWLFDDSANELQPVAYNDYIEDIFDQIPSYAPGDTSIAWQSFITDGTIALDDVRESEHLHAKDTPVRSGTWIPLGDHGVIAIVSEEVGGFDQQTQRLADHLAATAEATLDRVERETSLREREQELQQQNQRLEDLNRMNEIIRDIDQALVQAETRDGIEQAVCELLTQSDRFTFAWVGEVVNGERLTPRTVAGSDQGYLDAVSLTTDTDDGPPAVTATSTGTATLTSNVAADLRGAPWRKAALARDLQSVVSIPLEYAEMTYGTLTVFATEPGTFDTRSKEMFEELGETIANAMNAAETREALLTDTVVELELAIHDPDDLLSQLAHEVGCQIDYGGIIPQSDGTTRVFFSANEVSPSTVHAAADDIPSVQQLAHISTADDDGDTDEHRFEMTVSGPTIRSTLLECGAVAQSIRVAEDRMRVVVELPNTTDVRTFLNRFEEFHSNTELIARRDKERTEPSQRTFETSLTDELTDRQLEILQTAYHSGYFEWPRERTGEEVAASLDITQPTFNGHLRAAERKLCAVLFDQESPFRD